MLIAKTVLKKGNDFIPIEEWVGKVDDPDYIEGAIIINVNGKNVLDQSLWDDVNYFWPYIINGLPDILDSKNYQTGFPDQPIRFCVSYISKKLLRLNVFCDDQEYVDIKISVSEYLSGMTRAAKEFLLKIQEISPESDLSTNHYLDLLSEVEKRIPYCPASEV